MRITSVSLLERIANKGEDCDWHQLFELYQPFVLRVIRSYPGLASFAEDVTQDVMLVLVKELPTFQRQRTGSFRYWLRSITVNQLRIALRKSKRFQQCTTEWRLVRKQIQELADPASIASQKWDLEHDCVIFERIIQAIKNEFSHETWLAFRRYAIDGQPPAIVANQLGLTINSVLLAKSRVIRRMRQKAAGLLDE